MRARVSAELCALDASGAREVLGADSDAALRPLSLLSSRSSFWCIVATASDRFPTHLALLFRPVPCATSSTSSASSRVPAACALRAPDADGSASCAALVDRPAPCHVSPAAVVAYSTGSVRVFDCAGGAALAAFRAFASAPTCVRASPPASDVAAVAHACGGVSLVDAVRASGVLPASQGGIAGAVTSHRMATRAGVPSDVVRVRYGGRDALLVAGDDAFLSLHVLPDGGGSTAGLAAQQAQAQAQQPAAPSLLGRGLGLLRALGAVVDAAPSDVQASLSLHDHGRAVASLFPCYDAAGRAATWVAAADTLGRVLVVDSRSCVVARVLKGYRDAECAWTRPLRGSLTSERLLVVHAPRRGLVEAWRAVGCRVLAQRAPRGSALVQGGGCAGGAFLFDCATCALREVVAEEDEMAAEPSPPAGDAQRDVLPSQ
eukprot:m51a1_g7426 hypothetical protein (432) ;mRNA; r:30010-31305